MTTALLSPAPPDREPLLWLAPAPLWTDDDVTGDQARFERPWLTELDTDDFVPAFLSLVAGDADDPAALRDRAPSTGAGTYADPLVLYRPLHGRYYLVTGSLVCRRVGLPDRTVLPRTQRVTFVIRRIAATGAEEAWVAAASRWVAVVDPDALVDGEGQHAMHPAPLAPRPDAGTAEELLGLADGRRRVHFGYVPVAGAAAQPRPLADPVAALAADPDRRAADDARLLELRLRVSGAWADIGAKAAAGVDIREPSLYLLLDLRDWLSKYLPEVLVALVADTSLPAGTAREAVRAHLDIDVLADDVSRRLGTVLGELAGYASLVTGATTARPATRYKVHLPPGGLPGFVDVLGGTGAGNGGLVLAALTDPGAPAPPAVVPPELDGLVVARPTDATAAADRYVLRLVYEHEPCVPLLSKASPVVRFAGNYDGDAPARKIRIDLPDPSNLRRFNRGVAMDMPPSLRRMLDRVTPKMLKEEPPGPEGQWELGMICAFSLQIIMLVAFIVMFIFLILLNIVFWWLPFLKICFPVPRKRGGG